MIEGESGTGKEMIASALHAQSLRAGRPFIRINCAAIPATLIESELFGYRKGAFTGADHDRRGLIEATAGGTLLLDESGRQRRRLERQRSHCRDAALQAVGRGHGRSDCVSETHRVRRRSGSSATAASPSAWFCLRKVRSRKWARR